MLLGDKCGAIWLSSYMDIHVMNAVVSIATSKISEDQIFIAIMVFLQKMLVGFDQTAVARRYLINFNGTAVEAQKSLRSLLEGSVG